MIELIFVLSFGLSILTTMLATMSNWKWWYWVAGLCVYIFSFIGIWDFRGYTLCIAFGLWSLAIGHSLQLITKLYHSIIAVAVGISLWFVILEIMGDSWLFLPYKLFYWLVS